MYIIVLLDTFNTVPLWCSGLYLLELTGATRMPDSLQFLPIKPNEFDSLPAGFEYAHEISEASNTITFDTGVDARDLRCCVVCGRKAAGGPHPGVTRAHVIGKTEDILVRDCFLF
jgi:hypothetical protein